MVTQNSNRVKLNVSIQLISLASREVESSVKVPVMSGDFTVSIQLISLASREVNLSP
ncbi:hypothetical protein C789_952 [Microcystis aeruginosa FACHB-905 = DIANCHI905]|nr:hypothetical protein C789_952 [Microcystis aeruginosa FACHB-905 = DIANCHI905]